MKKIWYLIAGFILLILITKGKSTMEFYNKYHELIFKFKTENFPNLEVPLVMAIMENESNFKESAYRYEAHLADASFGLMQILYTTAQWMGFTGSQEELYIPENNIFFGMKFLDWLGEQTDYDMTAMIHSYNEGLGNWKKGKRVPVYYAKVYASYLKWSAIL